MIFLTMLIPIQLANNVHSFPPILWTSMTTVECLVKIYSYIHTYLLIYLFFLCFFETTWTISLIHNNKWTARFKTVSNTKSKYTARTTHCLTQTINYLYCKPTWIFCMATPMACSAVICIVCTPPLRRELAWVSITAWLSLARPRISNNMSPAMMVPL